MVNTPLCTDKTGQQIVKGLEDLVREVRQISRAAEKPSMCIRATASFSRKNGYNEYYYIDGKAFSVVNFTLTTPGSDILDAYNDGWPLSLWVKGPEAQYCSCIQLLEAQKVDDTNWKFMFYSNNNNNPLSFESIYTISYSVDGQTTLTGERLHAER